MSKIIHSNVSGHTFYVEQVAADSLPKELDRMSYMQFYAVRHVDKNGVVFMYLGTGNPDAKREIVVWHGQTLAFWHSYGETLTAAIEGAQKDGWLYA